MKGKKVHLRSTENIFFFYLKNLWILILICNNLMTKKLNPPKCCYMGGQSMQSISIIHWMPTTVILKYVHNYCCRAGQISGASFTLLLYNSILCMQQNEKVDLFILQNIFNGMVQEGVFIKGIGVLMCMGNFRQFSSYCLLYLSNYLIWCLEYWIRVQETQV